MRSDAPGLDTGEGILFVGHGSHDPVGCREFLETVGAMQRRLGRAKIAAGFLEIARPTVAESLSTLLDQGAIGLVVVPVLLFAAGHAKDDIPALVFDALPSGFDGSVRFAGPLSCEPSLVQLSILRFREACETAGFGDCRDVARILVGRGSSDADAAADMQRFVDLQQVDSSAAETHICYAAARQPSLASVLAERDRIRSTQVIVQPHLLFSGTVLRQIQDQVREKAASDKSRQWQVAEHLGNHPLVLEALTSRLRNLG